ncbi:hypothetical protein DC522_30785 [Microvirga sp. KLBC 81]|nr:hypothetical protein DC522_30785 [Microvirga sp. KLBC 81]
MHNVRTLLSVRDQAKLQRDLPVQKKVTDLFTIVSGRYWRLALTGTAHFEETPRASSLQVHDWKA